MADNMSFLPEDYLARRVARRTNIICITLFAVVLAGVVGAWFVTTRQHGQIADQREEVAAAYDHAAKQLQQVEELSQKREQMVRKASITSQLKERVPRSLILAELINHMPMTLSLIELELEAKDAAPAEAPRTSLARARARLAEKQDVGDDVVPVITVLNLTGVAPSDTEVSQFLRELREHELFVGESLQYSEQVEIEKQPMRKFRIELEINPAVDVSNIEPTRIARQELKMDPMGGERDLDAVAAPLDDSFTDTGPDTTPVAADERPRGGIRQQGLREVEEAVGGRVSAVDTE